MAKRQGLGLDAIKGFSSECRRRNKRVYLASPDELLVNDWISAIATPAKPRSKRVFDCSDVNVVFKAKDQPLRDLVNSRLLEENTRTNFTVPMEDDAPDLDHTLGNQTLDSPLPCTPPRKSGYSLDRFLFCDGSPFSFSSQYSSPTVTLAVVRNDIPSLPPSKSADNWLTEPSRSLEYDNSQKGSGRSEATSFLFGLGSTLVSSCGSISSLDHFCTSDEGEKDMRDRAEWCLDGSPSLGSCSHVSTPTPSLV
ncbi:hypothetical protein PM082_007911 [Marasmius tenuissimus]|nr:hypothetical protein PM082_007911 [Marasmius tenuissimus]